MKAYMKLSAISNIIFWTIFSLTSCRTKENIRIEFINHTVDSVTSTKAISMKDLVKNYNSLDGQTIETVGIAYYEFENVAICQDNGQDSKCFWLDLNRDIILNDSLLQKASGQRFILKGTIDNSSKGHLNAYLGTIRNVYYLKSR
jgi:hypothetical protein